MSNLTVTPWVVGNWKMNPVHADAFQLIEEFKQHAEFIGHAPQGRNRRIEAAIQRLKDDGRLRNEGERFFYIDKSNVYQFPVGDYKGGETMDATEGAPKDNDTS